MLREQLFRYPTIETAWWMYHPGRIWSLQSFFWWRCKKKPKIKTKRNQKKKTKPFPPSPPKPKGSKQSYLWDVVWQLQKHLCLEILPHRLFMALWNSLLHFEGTFSFLLSYQPKKNLQKKIRHRCESDGHIRASSLFPEKEKQNVLLAFLARSGAPYSHSAILCP